MQIIREIENYVPDDSPLYLALGNFDGLHKGHQKLVSEMVATAQSDSGIAAAFVFDPHPSMVLFPEKTPKFLVTSGRKAELMEKLGVNLLIYNSFNQDIAKCLPEEFVKRILINKLRVKHVFVGFNYTFGYKGAGNSDLLKELGLIHGFKVSIIPPVEVNGEVVSSSLIRQALDDGNIAKAKFMLGYNPMLEGTVIKGEQRGRTIGFPTANIGVTDTGIPGKGVYAARCKVNQTFYQAVVNIGSKPTFHEEYPVSIEAHLIDFEDDIYGKTIRLYFFEKIRNERKFNSADDLVKQITFDRDRAKQILSTK